MRRKPIKIRMRGGVGYLLGHAPFVCAGERFAVTRCTSFEGNPMWRATHVATGAALAGSMAYTQPHVKAATSREIARRGKAAFRAALKSVRARIKAKLEGAK